MKSNYLSPITRVITETPVTKNGLPKKKKKLKFYMPQEPSEMKTQRPKEN
jgi:hypothetical protein